MALPTSPDPDRAEDFKNLFDAAAADIATTVRGHDNSIRLALICLLAEGHLLIEDVPGIGKTSLAKALARCLGLTSRRIQFTPDLVVSDITGATVFHRETGTFEFRRGAVFANIVIADEINRASPRTQSALLEAMEERQVTDDAVTHRLPSPFMVVATQNPSDHEGTFPLPESQLDRFMFRIRLGYPNREHEIALLDNITTHPGSATISMRAGPSAVEQMMAITSDVFVAPSLREYMVDIAAASRDHPSVRLGMSPRATLALQQVARVRAASLGRDYVLPDDVKALLPALTEHRLVLNGRDRIAGMAVAQVLADILAQVAVPTRPSGPQTKRR